MFLLHRYFLKFLYSIFFRYFLFFPGNEFFSLLFNPTEVGDPGGKCNFENSCTKNFYRCSPKPSVDVLQRWVVASSYRSFSLYFIFDHKSLNFVSAASHGVSKILCFSFFDYYEQLFLFVHTSKNFGFGYFRCPWYSGWQVGITCNPHSQSLGQN